MFIAGYSSLVTRYSLMLLTITTIHTLATDLGYLLIKNPARAQTFDLAFGQAHMFYPEATLGFVLRRFTCWRLKAQSTLIKIINGTCARWPTFVPPTSACC